MNDDLQPPDTRPRWAPTSPGDPWGGPRSGDRPPSAAGWPAAAPGAPSTPPGAGVDGASAFPSRPPIAPPPYAASGGVAGYGDGRPPTHPTAPASSGFGGGSVGPPSSGRPSRRGVGAVLTAAAVFLAGAGGVYVGHGLADDSGTGGTGPQATATEATTVSTTPGPVSPDDPEPAAAVAAALSPAVVQIETDQGLGSGFVYDGDGLVMTAAHVVDGARRVHVRLADGRRIDGQVLGTDAATDVAVVKIDAVDGLVVADLAVGVDLQVGQTAIAIGSPFGLDQSVTAGIVSALGRTTETPGGAIPAIQTDAPINSGNSGGALADRQGRVIGINSSIITGGRETTGNVGIGFAVPIDIAKVVADRIVAGESTVGGYLGVRGADAVGDRSGSTITSVEPGSPAAAAGLEADDVVTAVDDHQVSSMIDLVAQISTNRPGDRVTLTVVRGGQERTIEVTLGSAPAR